jgi:hypothetical protein
MEISGGSAMREPEYLVSGTRGALKSSGKDITLKYIKPDQVLEDRKANPGTPGTSFGTPEKIEWVEETIPVQPKLNVDTASIWNELYAAVREGADFPIKLSEAVEVMKVVSEVKKNTPFEVK